MRNGRWRWASGVARRVRASINHRGVCGDIAVNYYNEMDKDASEWLRRLIDRGLIPEGDVDGRSIEDVLPNELAGYTQCHFFAGVGGWSYALALAGWPADRPVWTGSCPCQPFSAAGKGKGFADDRHLWPAFHWLIDQCRPATLFGEQVAGKAGISWLDNVSADLEGCGYAVGAVTFPACSVGAPHMRQRLYWVANSGVTGLEGHAGDGNALDQQGRVCAQSPGPAAEGGPTNGHWANADWVYCRDDKLRPVEPGTFPLVNGLSGRARRLRGYGNAIVPQAAAEFIGATL